VLPFSVLLITDEMAARRAGRGVLETVARALLPEAPGLALLVRAPERSAQEVERLAAALLPIGRKAGALVLVHTHVPLVAALGLDGAHLSSRDEARKARARMRPAALLGASRHAGDPLDEAALAPLAWVTLSPVFSPSSKPADPRQPLGLEGLERLAARCARPVVALGGVDARRAGACIRAGAAAVAVLGGVMSAHDPRRATLDLLEAVRRPEQPGAPG
jgi:thiamine-phosphate pyrophosphorylase